MIPVPCTSQDTVFTPAEPDSDQFPLQDVPEFALPDHHDRPSGGLELGDLTGIPFHVLSELRLPKGCACPWSGGVSTAWVTMPEAAVHEHHGVMLRQHDVRGTGKVPSVQPEAVSELMKKTADPTLGRCVTATDCGHVSAALVGNVRLARIFSHPEGIARRSLVWKLCLHEKTGRHRGGSGWFCSRQGLRRRCCWWRPPEWCNSAGPVTLFGG